MPVEDKVKSLARLFAPKAHLYAVGGYVRDKIMNLSGGDLDICSELGVDEVKTLLKDTDFVVSDRNLRMGTVIITDKDFKAEYTSFRVDSYAGDTGEHCPESVRFTRDIEADALRRDFKMNAVYLDILSGGIIDFTGGVADIKNKTVSAADAPGTVFGADGLRVLRMVRFASELGFEVEQQTMDAAKRNAWRVKDIAPERVRDELDRIFTADTRHPELGTSDAHIKGVRMLDELGLIAMLFPELEELKDLKQPARYHLYDAYRHSVETYGASEPDIRWAALFHDVGKAEAVKREGNMHSHAVIGEELVSRILGRLKFSKARASLIKSLVRWHMVDINANASSNKLRWFIAEHSSLIEPLCNLTDADAAASSGRAPLQNRLRDIYNEMLESGAPLSLRQLKIDGGDLIGLGVPENRRGELMRELWRETVMNENLNDRQKALDFIKKRLASAGRGNI